MTLFRPMMLASLCLVSAQAFAQWQWIGSDGRKVFSDRPPPPDVPQQNILKQPGNFTNNLQRQAMPSNGQLPTGSPEAKTAPQYGDKPSPSAIAAASSPAPASSQASTDPSVAEKAKQQASAEAEAAKQRKEIEAKNAEIRADNCNRAKEAKTSLSSGMRIAKLDEKGERIVLDDAARTAELKRVDDIIASQCNG